MQEQPDAPDFVNVDGLRTKEFVAKRIQTYRECLELTLCKLAESVVLDGVQRKDWKAAHFKQVRTRLLSFNLTHKYQDHIQLVLKLALQNGYAFLFRRAPCAFSTKRRLCLLEQINHGKEHSLHAFLMSQTMAKLSTMLVRRVPGFFPPEFDRELLYQIALQHAKAVMEVQLSLSFAKPLSQTTDESMPPSQHQSPDNN